MKKIFTFLVMAGLVAFLLYVVASMPSMGDPENPTNSNVVPRYLENSEEEAGAENVVTGVILNYRGYDTMGEVTVIYAALAAVLAVLGREKRGRIFAYFDHSRVRSSVIVRTFVTFLIPFIILFSFYTILHGELSPGGGFQGGAIFGASMIIFTTIFGLWEASRRIPQKIRLPLEGAAVLTFFAVGLLGVLGGEAFLTYILPYVAGSLQSTVRVWLIVIVEIGIGIGGAMIFTSILFAMIREEEEVALAP